MAEARKKNVHTGHRGRVKQQFLTHGGESFQEHQILEMILFYALPQGDVNPLSHELLNKFGSLNGVLDAPPEALKQVVGITDHTVALFQLMTEVARRYAGYQVEKQVVVNSVDDAAQIFRPCFVGAKVELLYLISADAKGRMIACNRISEGSVDAVLLNQRKIIETALHHRASQLYLAHCHVTGMAEPSPDDVSSTAALIRTLKGLGIRLNDHLIFSDGDYVSLAQSGLVPTSN